MCGIFGYTGNNQAIPCIVEGLRRLEYRGYDSAGVAWVEDGDIKTVRAEGKLTGLDKKLAAMPAIAATTGIGHTRWATHGVPTERNAHPHKSSDGKFVLIHNGIIENFQELEVELLEKGYTFASDTDTEVLVNLIAECRKDAPNLLEAFARALRRATGAYAVALLSLEEPNVVYAARMFAPLIVGLGNGENFVASDIPAFLPYTRDVIFIDDGEIVRIDAGSCQVLRIADLSPVPKAPSRIDWDMQAAQKDGYEHFMLKEIFEQPRVISACLTGRTQIQGKYGVSIPELDASPVPRLLHIAACGSAYHAGLWGRQLIESWAKIPVNIEFASEFRYRDVVMEPDDQVLVISQSGETADTLAALRRGKELGAHTTCLCNVLGSSIAREADTAIFTQAGPEISVASTKAVCSQMVVLALMALSWGLRKGTVDENTLKTALDTLHSLPGIIEEALPSMHKWASTLPGRYPNITKTFFIGRGTGFPMALEGALKLKELAYIPAEGYASGEMKHGPIALVDPDMLIFALAPDDELFPKVKSNIEEVQARKGNVVALTNPPLGMSHASAVEEEEARDAAEAQQLKVHYNWPVPRLWSPLSAFAFLPALQLVSYAFSTSLGQDVDQPRNLAKSVTVE